MKQVQILLTGLLLLGAPAMASAQSVAQQDLANIAATNPSDKAIAPLIYLASDQLKGRFIGRPEIDTAALFIANQFHEAGALTVPGATGYFQIFTRQFAKPSSNKTVIAGSISFSGNDVLQFAPGDCDKNGSLVDIGNIGPDSLASIDLKGKIVLMYAGGGNRGAVQKDFRRIYSIQEALSVRGAMALLVLLNADADYWAILEARFNNEVLVDPNQSTALPLVVLRRLATLPPDFSKSTTGQASIKIIDTRSRELSLRNVLAYVPGADPKLRDQFIVLTSHYDHLGVDPQPKIEEGKLDSIYNGARDNATGTTAVIDAARYFSQFPPKRSILFITYTAEEEGLIGSEYYAAHPLVPLQQSEYNLNIDNASYDDTTLITLVGLHRTSKDSLIISACATFGLSVNDDPTGGSLFYESDNAPLAQKGVPAPTYSLGMRAMDSTIFNRYHRLSDESTNMDLHYVLKFIRAYILAAKNIADDPSQPRWTKGDEFEKKWQTLHP
jgi:Peptidase family M28